MNTIKCIAAGATASLPPRQGIAGGTATGPLMQNILTTRILGKIIPFMDGETHRRLRNAIYRILRPLARVMLRHGMAYGSYAELARKAFVEESLAHLRRTGARVTISAVSAHTGLTRKEAKRLVDYDIESGSGSEQRYNRAVRVVTGWSVDPRFLDTQERPRVLPVTGDNSFATLVHDYSGDVTAAAMLAMLEAADTVTRDDDEVRLMSRAYLPTRTPGESLGILGNDVAELLTSIDYNLTHPAEERVFQRKVSNSSVRAGALEAFRELSNRKSQELLEAYDEWLAEHEISGDSDDESTRYVSVGIYYFDNSL
jgi:hypothetical protein